MREVTFEADGGEPEDGHAGTLQVGVTGKGMIGLMGRAPTGKFGMLLDLATARQVGEAILNAAAEAEAMRN